MYLWADGMYVKAGLDQEKAAMLTVVVGIRDGTKRYRDRYPKACERLLADWERMVTFYRYPKAHWKHLRTSNVVESPFSTVRLRTGAARRYKKVENATALIWRVLMVAERRFRKLHAPALMEAVADGVEFVNGVQKIKQSHSHAA